MDTVKTYQKVNSQNEGISFGISKMEDVYAIRKGKVDEPHRHNFYTILIVNQAKGTHLVDFNAYDLGHRQIYFVAPGQVHQVIEEKQSKGFAMTFSATFLIENSISLSFINSLNLFQNYGHSPPLLPGKDQFSKIEGFASEIFTLFQSSARMKEYSIGAFLKLLLIECNNICSINPIEIQTTNSNHSMLRDFKKWVEEQYKKEHATSFYANQLNVTPDHLNRIIKANIGKTAKEYIQSRIITEAKRLLYFTDLSNKEIGYALGFNEPSNFSAFFKKCTQLSPSNFRKKEINP
jgi:AraC-like DNA-binding protein